MFCLLPYLPKYKYINDQVEQLNEIVLNNLNINSFSFSTYFLLIFWKTSQYDKNVSFNYKKIKSRKTVIVFFNTTEKKKGQNNKYNLSFGE